MLVFRLDNAFAECSLAAGKHTSSIICEGFPGGLAGADLVGFPNSLGCVYKRGVAGADHPDDGFPKEAKHLSKGEVGYKHEKM